MPEKSKKTSSEGRESVLGPIFFFLYGLFKRASIRRLIEILVLKSEGGGHYSLTIRRIFSKYHNVEIGMYSRGALHCKNLPPGTKIGRYCSIFPTLRIFSGNHPMNVKSTHAFFYNPLLGRVETDIIERTQLIIGNDVWIGHNAIILSTVSSVGDGAVIGAGAVVHQDVPPYAVVVGNPARTVRYRFSDQTIQALLESKWWNKSVEELRLESDSFREPLEGVQKVR
jgi:acetyltransferase-like isoleucine patch superfamily enzyme